MARARRTALVLVGGLAVAGAAAGGYLLAQDGEPATDPWMPTGAAAISPPPENPDEDLAMDTFTISDAALQISYTGVDEAAGGVVVGAYVAGLIEDGGRCVLTLTLDGDTASAESTGIADASTTSCGQMLVPVAEVSAGTWSVEVTYASPSGESVAPAVGTVEVP